MQLREEKTMTTERWNDEKLDHLADIVKGLTEKLEETSNIANSNARVIQALADAMAEAAEERRAAAAERREMLQLIVQQQSEIRGMQTENHRMWEILLDRRNQGDNPNT